MAILVFLVLSLFFIVLYGVLDVIGKILRKEIIIEWERVER